MLHQTNKSGGAQGQGPLGGARYGVHLSVQEGRALTANRYLSGHEGGGLRGPGGTAGTETATECRAAIFSEIRGGQSMRLFGMRRRVGAKGVGTRVLFAGCGRLGGGGRERASSGKGGYARGLR